MHARAPQLGGEGVQMGVVESASEVVMWLSEAVDAISLRSRASALDRETVAHEHASRREQLRAVNVTRAIYCSFQHFKADCVNWM